MAGLIPQNFIDDLLDRVDIVDVVSSRVQLKKPAKTTKPAARSTKKKAPHLPLPKTSNSTTALAVAPAATHWALSWSLTALIFCLR